MVSWKPRGRDFDVSADGRFMLMLTAAGPWVVYDTDRPGKCYGTRAECEEWATRRAG
jgi:hypothetical protein